MIWNFGHCSVRISLQSDEKLHVNIYLQNITGKTSLLRFFSDFSDFESDLRDTVDLGRKWIVEKGIGNCNDTEVREYAL